MRKFPKIIRGFYFIYFIVDIDGNSISCWKFPDRPLERRFFIEFSTRGAVVRMTAAKFSRDPKTDGGGHPLQIFSRDFGVALAKPL